jgi:transposase
MKTTKDTKIMSIDKAVKLINDYKKNNFNAYKTLIQNGYSDSVALKQAKRTIDVAKDKIDSALQLEHKSIRETSEIVSDLYSVVGLSREDVLKEYQSIINQNINLAVKLRALEPLIRQEGIKWDEKEEQKAPSVVIKVDEVHNHQQQDTE